MCARVFALVVYTGVTEVTIVIVQYLFASNITIDERCPGCPGCPTVGARPKETGYIQYPRNHFFQRQSKGIQ